MVSLPTRGNQAPLYRFLHHQSHGPAGATLGRIATDHRDDALPLAVLQHLGGAGPLLLIESLFEARVLVAASDLPHRFRSQPDHGAHLGYRLAIV